MDRRNFGRLGASLLAGAMLARSGVGLAQGANSGAAPSVAERLAPIAPELRPAARMMIESGFPALTEEALSTIGPDSGPPMPELLPDIPVAERDIEARGSLPAVKLFVVNSEPTLARPAILHIHGGGHLVGSARGELLYLQETARALDCTIVSVEYRLSPAARYTESTEDTYAGLKWLFDNASALGVDPLRIALMGESAGGGHAAILAIKARDRGEVPVLFQSLVYPMLDDRTGSTGAVPPHLATVGWSAPENRLGWRSFLGMEPGGADVPVAAVPSRLADLSGLPPAWIGVGAVDLFVGEDIDYARRLALAGVPVELLVTPGAFHGFDRIAASTVLAQTFTQSKLAALARAFSQG
ncbi:alpha/beta hydrolase [Aurantiacibacter xanthus]|uniref:Alpha/beta hydrolase n=1 Tax=Aurantiacibacter xanthus TaxID=1784712 RepID=A0A3A1P7K9_9SPHN|nr:alpha/beta hydrolase [Aurantiacibacter xanthus]